MEARVRAALARPGPPPRPGCGCRSDGAVRLGGESPGGSDRPAHDLRDESRHGCHAMPPRQPGGLPACPGGKPRGPARGPRPGTGRGTLPAGRRGAAEAGIPRGAPGARAIGPQAGFPPAAFGRALPIFRPGPWARSGPRPARIAGGRPRGHAAGAARPWAIRPAATRSGKKAWQGPACRQSWRCGHPADREARAAHSPASGPKRLISLARRSRPSRPHGTQTTRTRSPG